MGDNDSIKVQEASDSSTTGDVKTGQSGGDAMADSDALIAATISQDRAALQEAVTEYPTFELEVASISKESAIAIRQELGMAESDLIVGLPNKIAGQFGLEHNGSITLSADGKTILLGDRANRIVTSTPKGDLTRCMLSRGIRNVTGLHDHNEEKVTGKADLIPFTMVEIDGRKVLWLKVDQKKKQ